MTLTEIKQMAEETLECADAALARANQAKAMTDNAYLTLADALNKSDDAVHLAKWARKSVEVLLAAISTLETEETK